MNAKSVNAGIVKLREKCVEEEKVQTDRNGKKYRILAPIK